MRIECYPETNMKEIKQVINNTGLLTNPVQCVQELVTAYSECQLIIAEEKTKQRQIEAWEKTEIAKINALRDSLITYLDRSFDERADDFKNLLAIADQVMVSNDNEKLVLALNSITSLAKSSPFSQLADINYVRAALDDPDHNWKF